MTFALSYGQAPSNDYFPGELVTNLPFSTGVNNYGASSEPDEPLLVETGLGASVWWSWQAPAKGRLNLRADEFYPTFGVFTGNEVNHLTRVGDGDGIVSVSVQSGQTYRFAADTWPDSSVYISFGLDFVPSPPNDDFAARIPLSGPQVTVSGHNDGATTEPGEAVFPAATGATVWYSWVAPADGWVQTTASSETGRPVFIVYEGTSRTNLTTVVSSGSPSIPDSLNHLSGSSSQGSRSPGQRIRNRGGHMAHLLRSA